MIGEESVHGTEPQVRDEMHPSVSHEGTEHAVDKPSLRISATDNLANQVRAS